MTGVELRSPKREPIVFGGTKQHGRKHYLIILNEIGFLYSHFWELARAVQDCGWEVTIASGGVANPETAIANGMKFIRTNPSFGIRNPLKEFRSFLELRRAIRQAQPDVLHMISLKNCLLGGLIARSERVPGVLCAVTGLGSLFVEDRLLYRILRPIVLRILRHVCSHGNAVLALENPDDAQFFIEQKTISADRTRIIPGAGVPVNAVIPVERHSDAPKILYVSRMIRSKGVLELVEAAKLLHARGLKFTVDLVGDVDERNPTSLTIPELEALRSQSFISWLGKRSDVPRLLDNASIFCLPTYYREGLPRCLVEASAAGLPIVTTDVPGCREVVVHGETGYLVPPRNVASLVDALAQLIEAPKLRENMGKAGRRRFEERFTTASVLRAFMSCHSALGFSADLV